MDMNYPHWYQNGSFEGPEEFMVKDCCEEFPYRMFDFHRESLKDRILCMLGCEVLFSVDARICGRESFCGTLCYVGCDFIIVNVNVRRRCLSMHVPLCALRFIAPFK